MRNWLADALSEGNPAARGRRSDYDLNRDAKLLEQQGKSIRDAAVLVPVVNHPGEPTILLTKRTDHLTKHAGQVSFPGGKVDEGDADAVAAALREAHEEVGLEPNHVEVCGFLDTYRTGTGFEIVPVVGLVQPGFKLTLQESEVQAAFEVPLHFLLDRNNHQRESAMWQGIRREYYAMPYGDYFIWGATAAMLVNLCDVMEAVRENAT
ncbi:MULTISPECIES: CoA pyrophosphatase [Kordiimonas]|jgi:8-oxo-dGTP pyrophosphatase MutT (NUDIX family)|uniref:NUDIX domain-containing protein n=1 Tax=Kordiimonas lacus TaxID=637679 RepID=A0A1G7DB39_9PROT|nr:MULTISPECIES: CoA pyrophosphatase [Kordiimonas]SDE48868.1 NUDIX domain-containing protein [Kordiimonas lacus]